MPTISRKRRTSYKGKLLGRLYSKSAVMPSSWQTFSILLFLRKYYSIIHDYSIIHSLYHQPYSTIHLIYHQPYSIFHYYSIDFYSFIHRTIMSSTLEDLRQLLASKDGISKKLLLRDVHEIIVGAETPAETATRM